MTPSAAEALGYERASKTSKITRFGQQNPLSVRWNIDKQLALWHSAWEDVTNRYLERIGAKRGLTTEVMPTGACWSRPKPSIRQNWIRCWPRSGNW